MIFFLKKNLSTIVLCLYIYTCMRGPPSRKQICFLKEPLQDHKVKIIPFRKIFPYNLA